MTTDTSTAADLLRSAVGRVGLATATDGELVRRYADRRDDLAFAELVHRFAPAVYAVCRRHLSDPGAADDAFQAVFVLLARKAGSLTHPDRVGGWLFATADKVARTARRRQSKRSDRFRPLESVPEPSAPSLPTSDLRTILDDELAKLPPHYRAVVLLCDVDGVSRRDAAARLNIPTGTLSNRLTRARAVLGRRLLRRGVLVAAGAVVSSGSMATPPARLLASAVRVALADSPPTELLSLLTPVVPPMVRAKQLLLLLGGLVLIGGSITGVAILMQKPTPPPTTEGEAEPPKPAQPVTPTTAVNPNAPKREWVEPKFGEMVTASASSADRKWAVLAQDYRHPYPSREGGGRITVYDTTTWRAAHTLDLPDMHDFLRGAAITPDGKRVFLGWDNRGVHLWDTAEKKLGKQLDTGPEKGMCRSLRLTDDGSRLAGNLMMWKDGKVVGSVVRVWDAVSGEVIRSIALPSGNTSPNDPVSFADSGRTIVTMSLSDDGKLGAAQVIEWDASTGAEKRKIELAAAVGRADGTPVCLAVWYTPDGKRMVVGGGVRLNERNDPEFALLNRIRSFSGSVWVIDRESGKVVKTLVEHRSDFVRSLFASADGKKVVFTLTIPSRYDLTHGGLNTDAEFVELQQWDVATWERDWVKIVPVAERWKLMNGAAK